MTVTDGRLKLPVRLRLNATDLPDVPVAKKESSSTNVGNCSSFISITMPRIMIDPGCPYRLKPHWTTLTLEKRGRNTHDWGARRHVHATPLPQPRFMALNVSALPLVLAGPMLRRVEPRLASVFVALKHPRKVKLSLREYDPATGTPGAAVPGGEAEHETIGIGKYLHVCVASVQPTVDLRSGVTYSYDLQFTRFGTADPLDVGAAPDDAWFRESSQGHVAAPWNYNNGFG